MNGCKWWGWWLGWYQWKKSDFATSARHYIYEEGLATRPDTLFVQYSCLIILVLPPEASSVMHLFCVFNITDKISWTCSLVGGICWFTASNWIDDCSLNMNISYFRQRAKLKSKEPPQTFVPKILVSWYPKWANCKGFLEPKSVNWTKS